jgi:hypothetical protein
MPNPYDDLFDFEGNEKPKPRPAPSPAPEGEEKPRFEPGFRYDVNFDPDAPDELDEILAMIEDFNKRAGGFSRLLSQLRVVDHQVKGKVIRMFFVTEDPHKRGTLAGEKQYHALQAEKFRSIILPMRQLAELHLETVKQFNREIDEHYFSAEKTEGEIASQKTLAMDGINLQRKILSDAAEDLKILADGLADTERRIKGYVNKGGKNNISASEYELISREREALTSGRAHQFDFKIFDANLLDKTALSLGIYMKETTAQYLGKLGKALQ